MLSGIDWNVLQFEQIYCVLGQIWSKIQFSVASRHIKPLEKREEHKDQKKEQEAAQMKNGKVQSPERVSHSLTNPRDFCLLHVIHELIRVKSSNPHHRKRKSTDDWKEKEEKGQSKDTV